MIVLSELYHTDANIVPEKLPTYSKAHAHDVSCRLQSELSIKNLISGICLSEKTVENFSSEGLDAYACEKMNNVRLCYSKSFLI
jgi:hypothetical protein